MKHLALLLIAACGSPPVSDTDRRTVSNELVAEVVLPTLDDIVTATIALTASAQGFSTSQTADTLAALQAAWVAARVPWKHSEAFGFGPLDTLRLEAAMDQAIEPIRIETEVTNTPPVSEPYVDALGANIKGFHAIEYLLFGGDPAARLALLSTDADAPRRRALIVAWAQNVERRAGELRTGWTAEAEAVANAGRDPLYPTAQAPIDKFVNESVFLSELVADARLGKPSGTATGGTPQPDLEESGPSDNSLTDMTSSLDGLRDIYFGTRDGTPGKGIGKLVRAHSSSIDGNVVAALELARADIAAIPRPYRTALEGSNAQIQEALASVKELKVVLSTEVVSTLGVTLTFNDNDGD